MSAAIVQSKEVAAGNGSSLTLDAAPQSGSYLLAVCEQNILAPNGVSSVWVPAVQNNATPKNVFVGLGPFTPNGQGQYKVTMAPGHSPPQPGMQLIEMSAPPPAT